MPDNEKLKLFKRIGMRIVPTCLSCDHGKFKINADWGLCSKHQYPHKKHTGTRPGPAHACFCCDDHEQAKGNLGVVFDIGVYAEILPVVKPEKRGEE